MLYAECDGFYSCFTAASATPLTERVEVSAGEQRQLIEVEANGLTSTAVGGAVSTQGGLEISDSSFTGNTTDAVGGAIRVNVTNGQLTKIQNTTFSENKAIGYDVADSGAISIGNGDVVIDNSKFLNNEAKVAGAIYAYTGNNHYVNVSIKNSVFDGNTADAIGAVGNFASARNADTLKAGGMTIENTVFKNNKATASNNDGAGALFLGSESQTSITGGEFTGNTSASRGGAISMRTNDLGNHSTANLDINGVLFENNTAATQGGAIFNTFYNSKTNSGAVTIASSRFNSNEAAFGGAIYNDGTGDRAGNIASMNLSDLTFTGNTAKFGGAIFNQGTLTFENGAQFTENKANGGAGGAIYNYGSINALDNATFSGNTASQGGAINNAKLASSATPGTIETISNSTFSNNSAGSSQGGAIRNQGVIGSIINSVFDSNTAGNGGAINNGTWGTIDTISSIEGSMFVNNKASGGNGQGGAITNAGSIGSVKNVTFEGNSADNIGGAFANVAPQTNDKTTKSSVSFENVTFTGNTAGANGGAIYNAERGNVNLNGTNTFTGNTAAGVANDIYNLGTLNITGGTTTIDGGIDGTGALNVSSGATLDIGTAKVSQDSITFDAGSTLKANLLNTTSYGSLEANTIAGNGAALSLTFGSAGEYVIAKGTGADSFADATVADTNSLYDIVKTSSDADTLTYTASVKAAEDIANDAGVSTQTASVLSTLANASNDAASQIALNLQNELAAGNKDAVESAATDLAPTNTSTVHSVATTVHSQILGAVNNRLATPSMGRSGGDLNAKFGPWVQGLYNKSKQDSSSATQGFRGYTQGVAFGLDTLINDVYTVGVGYAYNATDVKSGGRKTDVYGHNFFIYGEYQPNAWFVNGTVNYSTSDYKEQRAVTSVGIASKYDVDTWGGQVMTGYDMASGLTPKAGLRYLHIKQDSYTDTLGQNVKTDNTDLLTAVAGVNYAYDFVEKDYTLTPEVRLAATYDIVSDNADATVVMGTGSYTTSGKRLPRFGVEAGVGVTMNMFDALDVSLNYDAGIRRDYTSHTGTVKFKYNF